MTKFLRKGDVTVRHVLVHQAGVPVLLRDQLLGPLGVADELHFAAPARPGGRHASTRRFWAMFPGSVRCLRRSSRPLLPLRTLGPTT
jgi:CubicO group peptidase (beta-lactamase class C family)